MIMRGKVWVLRGIWLSLLVRSGLQVLSRLLSMIIALWPNMLEWALWIIIPIAHYILIGLLIYSIIHICLRKVIRNQISLLTIMPRVFLYTLCEVALIFVIWALSYYPFIMISLAIWFGWVPADSFYLFLITTNLIVSLPIFLYFIFSSMISYRIMKWKYEWVIWRYDTYLVHWLPLILLLGSRVMLQVMHQTSFEWMFMQWIGQIILILIVLYLTLKFFFVKSPIVEKVAFETK
jgi:hypothetical protein